MKPIEIDVKQYREYIFNLIPTELNINLWSLLPGKEYTKNHDDYNQHNKYHITRIVIEKEYNIDIPSVIDTKIYIPKLQLYVDELYILNYRFHLSRKASPHKLIYQILIPNLEYTINKFLIANEFFDLMADSYILNNIDLSNTKIIKNE